MNTRSSRRSIGWAGNGRLSEMVDPPKPESPSIERRLSTQLNVRSGNCSEISGTHFRPVSQRPTLGNSRNSSCQERKQSARHPADKGARSHRHRAALSIYRWCERKLRSRSTPQRSAKHVGSTILRTIIDIRIPPGAGGNQSPPAGQGDAAWCAPHGAFAKSPADRRCGRGQQVADVAGTPAANLKSGLGLPDAMNFSTSR